MYNTYMDLWASRAEKKLKRCAALPSAPLRTCTRMHMLACAQNRRSLLREGKNYLAAEDTDTRFETESDMMDMCDLAEIL